jgi:hypothetical protein
MNAVSTLVTPKVTTPPSTTGKTAHSLEWLVFGVVAVAIAAVTVRHEMFRDELQAWLIARDSHSLSELLHNMRYEGHPALWQLLLYLPAHLSWNPVSMQVINYLCTVAQVWLILSARRLSWPIRILAVFSVYIFYDYGVIARNYMLGILLLTAAARCLLAERPRRWLAVVLLALAINTHFFAIPVAFMIFVWLYSFPEGESWKSVRSRLQEKQFWIAAIVLAVSVTTAFLVLRPPVDRSIATNYYTEHNSVFDYVEITVGRSWLSLIPISGKLIPDRIENLLYQDRSSSLVAVWVSISLLALATAALPAKRARFFFLSTAVLLLACMAATIHEPLKRHFGFLFVAYLIALLMSVYSKREERPWLPMPVASTVLLGIFGLQALAGLSASAHDWISPFSEAKETSTWLKKMNLDNRPLVIQTDSFGAGILGYAEISTAYYPACKCYGSFTVWKKGRDPDRAVSREELSTLYNSTHQTPILISNWALDATAIQQLHVRQRLNGLEHNAMGDETFFVYEQVIP